MHLFQWAQNPWGQEIPLHISWNLLWAAAAAGVLFIAAHLLYRRGAARRAAKAAAALNPPAGPDAAQRLVRHSLASRLFHWVMAASIFVLLFTSLLPLLGLKFSWVTLHWAAGLVLFGSVAFHIVHASFWLNLRDIWISRRDLRDWWRDMKEIAGRPGPPGPKPGKYPVENKFFHHLVLVATFAAIGTGLLMMVRVETPFWTRNPYLLADATWGWVYVAHGLSSVALVTLVMAHVYFAILPEKRWLTVSMIAGWITRQNYVKHHDPERWVAEPVPPAVPGQPQHPPRLEQELT